MHFLYFFVCDQFHFRYALKWSSSRERSERTPVLAMNPQSKPAVPEHDESKRSEKTQCIYCLCYADGKVDFRGDYYCYKCWAAYREETEYLQNVSTIVDHPYLSYTSKKITKHMHNLIYLSYVDKNFKFKYFQWQ